MQSGYIESKAADMERERSEPGKLERIPSLGVEERLIARTAGSTIAK
jgi:hypothetical protein